MNIDLDKKDLIALVRGSDPDYGIMEEPLIAKAGRYVGGFTDSWQWGNLEQLTEIELEQIYLRCKWSHKEENRLKASPPQEPDPNRKVVEFTGSKGEKYWMDLDAMGQMENFYKEVEARGFGFKPIEASNEFVDKIMKK